MAHVGPRALMLGLTAAGATPLAAASLPLENAVKASYLYKFAPFVQWPAAAFASPNAPLTICVSGENPFGHMIDEAVQGQRVNGHPFEVQYLPAGRSGAGCHILFAGGSDAQDSLQPLADRPVLTVSDSDQGHDGAIIQFVTVGGHVRFTINQAAAAASGITISSKLLGLALRVRR